MCAYIQSACEAQNSIAQSMLDETLTIEHDIDMFKLILVSLSLSPFFSFSLCVDNRARFFFHSFTFAGIAMHYKHHLKLFIIISCPHTVASILNIFVQQHQVNVYMHTWLFNNFESKAWDNEHIFFSLLVVFSCASKCSFHSDQYVVEKNLICVNIQVNSYWNQWFRCICNSLWQTVHCILTQNEKRERDRKKQPPTRIEMDAIWWSVQKVSVWRASNENIICNTE